MKAIRHQIGVKDWSWGLNWSIFLTQQRLNSCSSYDDLGRDRGPRSRITFHFALKFTRPSIADTGIPSAPSIAHERELRGGLGEGSTNTCLRSRPLRSSEEVWQRIGLITKRSPYLRMLEGRRTMLVLGGVGSFFRDTRARLMLQSYVISAWTLRHHVPRNKIKVTRMLCSRHLQSRGSI